MTYLVFAFDTYYPSGGTNDLVGQYRTFAEALSAIEVLRSKVSGDTYWPPDYAQVYETDASAVVAEWQSTEDPTLPADERLHIVGYLSEGPVVGNVGRWHWNLLS